MVPRLTLQDEEIVQSFSGRLSEDSDLQPVLVILFCCLEIELIVPTHKRHFSQFPNDMSVDIFCLMTNPHFYKYDSTAACLIITTSLATNIGKTEIRKVTGMLDFLQRDQSAIVKCFKCFIEKSALCGH